MKQAVSVLLLCGAFAASRDVEAKVNVVTTVPDLAALTRAVGGDRVSVTALSLPTQDPRLVDARPSLVAELDTAHLLVAVGLDLEVDWLPTLQIAARNGRIIEGGKGFLDCSTVVRVLDGNPHYLYDPRQARACARAIATKLAEIDPEHGRIYSANLASFIKELDAAIARWERRVAGLRGRQVIVYHRSWNYFADWIGLDLVAELEPAPGVPPTPRHVAGVLERARSTGARIVLQEAYYPNRTGRLVASKLDGELAVLPGGTDVASGEGYIEHMDRMIALVTRRCGS